jgi:hypothetical protein
MTKDLLARLGRVARKTGRALLWLVALLVVVHAVWGYVEARRLERAIAGIRAKGEPASQADLKATNLPVEDAENAGRFYSAALELTVPSTRVMRPKNPFRVAHEAGPGREPTADERSAVQAHLDANQAAFEMLDRGTTLPSCRFTWWKDDELPPFLPMRVLSDLSSLRVWDLAYRGQGRQALEAWLGLSRFLRIFDGRVPLIAFLVRDALLDQLIRDTPLLLERGALDEEHLARLRETLGDLDRPRALTDALVGERAWVAEMLTGSQLRRGQRPSFGLSLDGPFWKHETVGYMEAMQAMIDASRLPSPASLLAAKNIRPRGLGQRIALPSLERALAHHAEVVARLRAARAAVDVTGYRLSHGGPPGPLAELAPPFDAADPFTGRPLFYRVEAEGFRVYSTGPDGRDDGGKVEGAQPKDVGMVVRWAPAAKAAGTAR